MVPIIAMIVVKCVGVWNTSAWRCCKVLVAPTEVTYECVLSRHASPASKSGRSGRSRRGGTRSTAVCSSWRYWTLFLLLCPPLPPSTPAAVGTDSTNTDILLFHTTSDFLLDCSLLSYIDHSMLFFPVCISILLHNVSSINLCSSHL